MSSSSRDAWLESWVDDELWLAKRFVIEATQPPAQDQEPEDRTAVEYDALLATHVRRRRPAKLHRIARVGS